VPPRNRPSRKLNIASILQRTHINTHANALLLRYAFEELGLRRVQWRANTLNAASISAARRFGFKLEGVMEWHRVLSAGKIGLEIPAQQQLGRPEAGPGRHSANMSITWERWAEDVGDSIARLMTREVKRQPAARLTNM
jgi:RimJ/RimL family protein N-acetyltransferase